MATFPNLTSGVTAKYPVRRTRQYRTQVYVALDMTEQRFSKGSPLEQFELSFNNVSTEDKETVREFFEARRGAFDATWSLELPEPSRDNPTTYEHLQFVPGTHFVAREHKPGRWQFSLQVRQTRNG